MQDENLLDWEIVSVSPHLIEIDLTFAKPLYVSQGVERDKLIMQVALSQFVDQNKGRLPVTVNKIKDVPLQAKSKSEVEACEEVASSSYEASTGTCAFQILISLLTKASLSQLWGMLNSQQIIVHLPMFNGLKFPANAMIINYQMI